MYGSGIFTRGSEHGDGNGTPADRTSVRLHQVSLARMSLEPVEGGNFPLFQAKSIHTLR